MTLKSKNVLVWRILVLVSLLTNGVITLPGPDKSISAASQLSLFTPAYYSLTIWPVLFISLLIYGVWQLLPQQRTDMLCTWLSKPLVTANLFSGTLAVLFREDWIMLPILFSALWLYLSALMYLEARNAVLKNEYSYWLSIPFSIQLAAVSVTLLTELSFASISLGWSALTTQLILSLVMTVVVSLLAVRVGYRCGDFVFPFTVSWMCIGIYSAHQLEFGIWGVIQFTFATLPAVWALITLINRISYRHKMRSNKFSFPSS